MNFQRFFQSFVLFSFSILLVGTQVLLAKAVSPSTPSLKPSAKAVVAKPAVLPDFRFFAVGDTGSGNPNQKAVADAMEKQAKTYHPKDKNTSCPDHQACVKAVLHLGDIIYPAGNASKDANRLVTQMYKGITDLGVPFYFSLGNHDMLKEKGQDVIQTLGMPKQGYYVVKKSPLVDFFAINTSDFNKNQLLWLQTQLASSRAIWKIVYGHHPLYSTGSHGQDGDLVALRKALEPTLILYKVDAYLAGHDHNYERFALRQTQGSQGLPYLHVVSGGGGAYLRQKRAFPKSQCTQAKNTKKPCIEPFFPKTLAYNDEDYHYLDISLSSVCGRHLVHQLRLQMRNVQNQVLDEVILKKP